MIKIKKITFDDISPMWGKYLPNMSLEETSAMSCFKKRIQDPETMRHDDVDHYDLENQKFIPTFWGAFDDDKLIGVNSGHMTLDRLYRSRGLFVKNEYRGQGIGMKLLLKTISQGYHEKAHAVWSYPKKESWETYKKCTFILCGENFYFEWESNPNSSGLNSRCIKILNKLEFYKVKTD